MARSVLAGTRIRDYRTARRMKQVDLASSCGISASYLNLIEHNRRRIGGVLLLKIAQSLDVDPSVISEGAEAALTTALDASATAFGGDAVERDRLEELASRFPGWAALIATQYNEVRRLEQVVERMDDRLTHDPFLSASMHNVLSSVTAIRSASGILASGETIEPEWQARFHRNIFEDSQRLTEATETLVAYLDAETEEASEGSLPQEDVDRWLAANDWNIAPLEENPDASQEDILGNAEGLTTAPARALARGYLEQYAQDRRRLDRDALLDGIHLGKSPGEIANQSQVPLPVVFRRLATLNAHDLPDNEPFGLVGCDGSGTLTFRKPVAGFDLPRYSGACPLWPLFQALQKPMVPVFADLTLAGRDEERYEVQAISEVQHPMGYDQPAVLSSWMLLRSQRKEKENSLHVGSTCRICAKPECPARREVSVFMPMANDAL